MSRPRAATSVATTSSSVPPRSFFITRSRSVLRDPAVQRLDAHSRAHLSASVRSSTSRRVRQNTSAAVGDSRSSTRPSAARLCPRATT